MAFMEDGRDCAVEDMAATCVIWEEMVWRRAGILVAANMRRSSAEEQAQSRSSSCPAAREMPLVHVHPCRPHHIQQSFDAGAVRLGRAEVPCLL